MVDGRDTGSGPVLLVGTREGAWLLRADSTREGWSVSEPMFLGQIVQHMVLDPRDRRHFWSAHAPGTSGRRCCAPRISGVPGKRRRVRRRSAPNDPLDSRSRARFSGSRRATRMNRVSGMPAGRRRASSGPRTAVTRGTRSRVGTTTLIWERWAEWPEEGTPDGSMLHSIIVDPRDAAHLYIGLSGGGVFESVDGGARLAAAQRGMGRDVPPRSGAGVRARSALRAVCIRRGRIACTSRTTAASIAWSASDGRWIRIGDNMPRDVGDIGFPIELHPRDPDTAWVFPMDGTDVWPRTSPDGRPAVFVTRDAGDSWTRCDDGLPERAWYTVKRQAMTVDDRDPVGVYFGTTCGELVGEYRRRRALGAHRGAPARDLHGRVRRSRAVNADATRVNVRIPTPLRSYTAQQSVVQVEAHDLATVFAELDRQFPGIRFRVIDEQGRLRQHMKVFVNDEAVRDLTTELAATDEVTIMQALSGG